MLNNLKIGTRLSCSFGILLVLLMLVGGYTIKEIRNLNGNISLLVNDRMVKVEQANKLINQINIVARAVRNLIIDDDKNRDAEEVQRIAEARKIAGGILKDFDNTIKQEKGRALLNKMSSDIRPIFSRHLEALLDLAKNNRNEEAKTLLLSDFRQIQSDYLKTINEFIEYQTNLANECGKDAEETANTSVRVISILLIAALALSVLLAALIVRSITVPVRKASILAETMAKGDFTNILAIDQKDEIGLMAKSLNTMTSTM